MKTLSLTIIAISCCIIGNAQNVGIGTLVPKARLHVVDSNVIFSSEGNVPATAANLPITGYGRRFIWYIDKAAIRAGRVTSSNWDKDSIGSMSVGMGSNVLAKGVVAIALGSEVQATGTASVALGNSTKALGNFSTATGYTTMATGTASFAAGIASSSPGDYAAAFGLETISKNTAGFVVGLYNDSNHVTGTGSTFPWNRVFEIGNGNSNVERSNALTVLKNGRVGIGVSIPKSRLHVADSSVLFSAVGEAASFPVATPVNGSGRRMMWYADKAALRAGYALGDEWDFNNIGIYSAAFGFNAKASGQYSVAMGYYVKAENNSAVAIGSGNQAIGNNSLALGTNSIASSGGSTVIGWNSKAQGLTATAIGYGVYGRSYGSITLGTFNDTSDVTSNITLGSQSRLLQVGNGTANDARSTALVLLQNGNMGLGTLVPDAKLDVDGKTATNQLQVGGGSDITKIQYGTQVAGSNGSGFATSTVTFPTAFTNTPKVIATARNSPAFTNINDTFVVSVRSVNNTQVVLNIQRVDANTGWAQSLLVDWVAVQ